MIFDGEGEIFSGRQRPFVTAIDLLVLIAGKRFE